MCVCVRKREIERVVNGVEYEKFCVGVDCVYCDRRSERCCVVGCAGRRDIVRYALKKVDFRSSLNTHTHTYSSVQVLKSDICGDEFLVGDFKATAHRSPT